MIRRAHYIVCDRCHDPAQISTEGTHIARKYANQEGYIRERSKESRMMEDICPRCQAEAEDPHDPQSYDAFHRSDI